MEHPCDPASVRDEHQTLVQALIAALDRRQAHLLRQGELQIAE